MSETTAVETQQQPSALVTIDPTSYVAAVYEPFSKRLADAVAKVEGVEYDVTTTAGMKTAKEYRALFRVIRIEADKERAARKAPILAVGKLLDSRNAEIEKAIEPHESKFDAEIKAEERRNEDERAAKLKAEEERRTLIQSRIDAIRNKPLQAISLGADDTDAMVAELSQMVADEETYGERFVEAEVAIKSTAEQLKQMVIGKRVQEELAEAQAKQQAEQSRIDAIRGRILAIKNLILDAAECDCSAKINAVLEIATNTVIDGSFQEFEQGAQQAKATTITSITRQRDAILHSEELARKAQEVAPAATNAQSEAPLNPADYGTHEGRSDAYAMIGSIKQATVIEHQDVIAAFLHGRDEDDKKKATMRAILVEFVKFQVAFGMRKAA
jgi:hypothetical protein